MNRTEALKLWQRVAAGELRNDQHIVLALQKRLQASETVESAELLELIQQMVDSFASPVDVADWVEEVARAVLVADQEPRSGHRPNGLTKAIGLSGDDDPYWELRNALSAWDDFDFLDEEGNPASPKRGEERKSLLRIAWSIYPAWKHLGDEEVLRRVRGVLKGTRRDL